jgi:hypothetical protein
MRRAWAPLTFTGETPPGPTNPVAPARRSAWAQAKASAQQDALSAPATCPNQVPLRPRCADIAGQAWANMSALTIPAWSHGRRTSVIVPDT